MRGKHDGSLRHSTTKTTTITKPAINIKFLVGFGDLLIFCFSGLIGGSDTLIFLMVKIELAMLAGVP